MTGSNTVNAALALAFGLMAALAIFLVLRAARRRASVHADLPPAEPRPADRTLAMVAPVLPSAPLTATIHYSDKAGQSSVREVVIHSRNLKLDRSHSLNIREGSTRTPKIFLIDSISRLDYSVEGEICSLSSAGLIRELLERVIPLKDARQRPDPAPLPEPRREAKPDTSPEVQPKARPGSLASLLPPGALGFAVIDLETTGFGAEHRILEIAVIRLDPDGRLEDVWETLVHPGMPVPRTLAQQKHRIHDWMVEEAPGFAAVAGDLASRLHGYVLVAHNLPFDQGFLERRFAAVEGIRISLGQGLNTMKGKESLEKLCLRLGVELPAEEAHSALVDARALQQALLAGIEHLRPAQAAVVVEHNGASQTCVLQTRAAVQTAQAPKGWSQLPMQLTPGAEFIKTDVSDAGAEALAQRLGLVYRQAKKVPVRRRPAFLLAEDLASTNTKMREARQQRLPVLLLRDLKDLAAGAQAMGWVSDPGDGQGPSGGVG